MILDKGSMQSNLECFLHCTTPVVQSQFLPKTEIRNLNSLWHPWEREKVEYFTLADLWGCYDEWSAYGAGVPIALDQEETLVQYYVPYLSAIQIFTSNSSINSFREEAEAGECETRDSYSDSLSDDSESDKLWRWDGCSSEEGGFEQDNNSIHLNDRLGHLYFQYFERSTPYGRVPLMDKINGLAQRYPGLMSLRSVDLSPASWMAVAWYPIYHIPMGRTIKDLSTCFLTYHTLSSSFQDMDVEDEIDENNNNNNVGMRKRKEGDGISLPPFGLATYKMQGNVWVSAKCGRDQERLLSLLSVADSWLKQLRVQHHDFNYFTGSAIIRR
ncbi:uncharacterized protein LOC115699650 [Cannabis sativa]|uniref:Plant/F9H3-4 protein n=1 Tax=Cannabis sativa TaxID=3483 RepID=A0A7J6HIS6_CANSA|nr:uncharacterized protein LOC115699650 [Cannabis sativa]XP_060957938.1 uncharacterized protein LOC115699650 [Cannabis sativa]KAF4382529.1 hypothetical protein F8388_015357 [Cannabis sativa]KAF4394340.1 hypothetical protein G4B88_018490 [Cannabis sativa]